MTDYFSLSSKFCPKNSLICTYSPGTAVVVQRRMSRAKQCAQGGTLRCSSSGIGEAKENTRQRTLIICVSRSSTNPPLAKTSSCFAVQNTGVSPPKTRSLANRVFGAGKCTVWPSSKSSKSCHGRICVNNSLTNAQYTGNVFGNRHGVF